MGLRESGSKGAPEVKCNQCGGPFIHRGGTVETLVGFLSPPGHDHDDNCKSRAYYCAEGHMAGVFKRNACPNPDCDWKGKEECWCHPGKKVEEWPNVSSVELS
jgi:hypothetical protein